MTLDARIEHARAVLWASECPVCGAGPGAPCWLDSGHEDTLPLGEEHEQRNGGATG